MKVEKIRYPRVELSESAPPSSHTYPPTTHRGAELEAELEVELEVELEFFARPRAGVHFHTLKYESYELDFFVPLKIFF